MSRREHTLATIRLNVVSYTMLLLCDWEEWWSGVGGNLSGVEGRLGARLLVLLCCGVSMWSERAGNRYHLLSNYRLISYASGPRLGPKCT